MVARKPFLLALLAISAALVCGCTSALWDKGTFAHHYRPASFVNLHLSYSKERQDILVQYNESRDRDTNTRARCYWLEANTLRMDGDRKPSFVSAKTSNGSTPIPVVEVAPNPTEAGLAQLYAIAVRDDDFFTLYSGTNKLDLYELPVYTGRWQRVSQVLLTPLAVAVDATIVGGFIGYYAAPWIFAGLGR